MSSSQLVSPTFPDSASSAAPNGPATGDLTGTYPAPTIAADAITYAKIQNISATQKLLGRNTAAAGDTEEVSLSQLLDWIGAAAQGDILYRNATVWARLGAGTAGQKLVTGGTTANPSWADGANFFGDGTSGSGVMDGAATIFGLVPSANTYTATSDINAINLTINSGIKLEMAGFILYVNGILTFVDGTSVVQQRGANASGLTGGAALGSTSLGIAGQAGAAGRSILGAGATTANKTNAIGGAGGNGGNAPANNGGIAGTVTAPPASYGATGTLQHCLNSLRALNGSNFALIDSGTGGGGGGCVLGVDTANSGAGGAAATPVLVWARYVVGAGLITSRGGNGSAATGTGAAVAGGGGGGGGCRVILVTSTSSPPCTLSSVGGTGGAGFGSGSTSGGNGSTSTTTTIVI